MRDPVETGPAARTAGRAAERLAVHVIGAGKLGDLLQIPNEGVRNDSPHFVHILQLDLVLTESGLRLLDKRQRGRRGGTNIVRCRVKLSNDVSVNAAIENLLGGGLHQSALVATKKVLNRRIDA